MPTLGALTGNQAVQQVKAGLKAIYLSGWQVAGDANSGGEMYPDQSLYHVDSVPKVVRAINNALRRCDQIATSEGGKDGTWWMAPIIADAEAGFGGPLNAYELMKNMIAAGAAGVHFEDQLASEKKCAVIWAAGAGADLPAYPDAQCRASRRMSKASARCCCAAPTRSRRS